MSGCGTTFKRVDRNRLRKTYPYLRRRPRYAYMSDKEIVIEVGKVAFNTTDSAVYTFTETFAGVPTVVGISADTGDSSADVNILVSDISTASVTFRASQLFTGEVNFHVIYIDCSS